MNAPAWRSLQHEERIDLTLASPRESLVVAVILGKPVLSLNP
jgi:hypothetical protein